MNVGILGTGMVASNLAVGLARAGHSVRLGSRAPANVKPPEKGVTVGSRADAVAFGSVVVAAVPFTAMKETINEVGAAAFQGKVLVDATNVFVGPNDPSLGSAVCGAEAIANLVPGAKVVKAFNTAFAKNMSTGRVANQRLVALVAGDDAAAKATVLKLAGDIGFDPVDAGPLASARNLEAMARQLIHLAFEQKMSPDIGFVLARK